MFSEDQIINKLITIFIAVPAGIIAAIWVFMVVDGDVIKKTSWSILAFVPVFVIFPFILMGLIYLVVQLFFSLRIILASGIAFAILGCFVGMLTEGVHGIIPGILQGGLAGLGIGFIFSLLLILSGTNMESWFDNDNNNVSHYDDEYHGQ